jgi:hypothetical protein
MPSLATGKMSSKRLLALACAPSLIGVVLRIQISFSRLLVSAFKS